MTSSKEERLRKVAQLVDDSGWSGWSDAMINSPGPIYMRKRAFAKAALIEAVYAEEIGRLRAGLEPFANVAVGRESWGDERTIEIATPPRTNVSRARLLMKEFRQAALALSTVEVEPSGAGQP